MTLQAPPSNFQVAHTALMTRVLTFSISRMRQASSSRVLSYLLLVLICYGSSVEVLHHHELSSQNASASQSSTELNANLITDGEQSKSSTKTPLERDCLVCQFQRGLSSTAFAAPLLVLAPTDVQINFSLNQFSDGSLSATASRGRAPPITL